MSNFKSSYLATSALPCCYSEIRGRQSVIVWVQVASAPVGHAYSWPIHLVPGYKESSIVRLHVGDIMIPVLWTSAYQQDASSYKCHLARYNTWTYDCAGPTPAGLVRPSDVAQSFKSSNHIRYRPRSILFIDISNLQAEKDTRKKWYNSTRDGNEWMSPYARLMASRLKRHA